MPDTVLLFLVWILHGEQAHYTVCVSMIIWKSCTENSSWLVQQMDSCSVPMIWCLVTTS